MKTTVLLDHEPVADGGWMVHALLRIEGQAPQARDRVPLNLSLVLDRSGSMAGEKLEAARQAAAMLVRRLSPDDTVSVVAFDDEVRVIADPATGDAQDSLPEVIRSIPAGGSTNLSGGWLRGRDLVAANLREGGVNRVILLTDGQANVGLTEPHQLTGLCATAAAAGVSTTTIGFGAGFDEALLTAMADAGRGATYYIERADQASGVFEEELEGLLSIAAQNVRVEVEPGSGVSDLKVLHDYPSKAVGKVLTLEIGDLYAREPRRVLAAFLVSPEGIGPAGTAALGRFTVTAHVLTDGGGVELQEIALPLTLSPEQGGSVEPEVRKEILLLEAARVRRDALEAQERGDFDTAAEALRAYGARVAASGLDDGELMEEARDLRGMAAAFDAHVLEASDVKYMSQRAYARSRSRSGQVQRFRREP